MIRNNNNLAFLQGSELTPQSSALLFSSLGGVFGVEGRRVFLGLETTTPTVITAAEQFNNAIKTQKDWATNKDRKEKFTNLLNPSSSSKIIDATKNITKQQLPTFAQDAITTTTDLSTLDWKQVRNNIGADIYREWENNKRQTNPSSPKHKAWANFSKEQSKNFELVNFHTVITKAVNTVFSEELFNNNNNKYKGFTKEQITRLAKTIMTIESEGNPYAISPTGALGLFQVTDNTRRTVSNNYHLPIIKDEKYEPFNPEHASIAGLATIRDAIDSASKLNLPPSELTIAAIYSRGLEGSTKMLGKLNNNQKGDSEGMGYIVKTYYLLKGQKLPTNSQISTTPMNSQQQSMLAAKLPEKLTPQFIQKQKTIIDVFFKQLDKNKVLESARNILTQNQGVSIISTPTPPNNLSPSHSITSEQRAHRDYLSRDLNHVYSKEKPLQVDYTFKKINDIQLSNISTVPTTDANITTLTNSIIQTISTTTGVSGWDEKDTVKNIITNNIKSPTQTASQFQASIQKDINTKIITKFNKQLKNNVSQYFANEYPMMTVKVSAGAKNNTKVDWYRANNDTQTSPLDTNKPSIQTVLSEINNINSSEKTTPSHDSLLILFLHLKKHFNIDPLSVIQHKGAISAIGKEQNPAQFQRQVIASSLLSKIDFTILDENGWNSLKQRMQNDTRFENAKFLGAAPSAISQLQNAKEVNERKKDIHEASVVLSRGNEKNNPIENATRIIALQKDPKFPEARKQWNQKETIRIKILDELKSNGAFDIPQAKNPDSFTKPIEDTKILLAYLFPNRTEGLTKVFEKIIDPNNRNNPKLKQVFDGISDPETKKVATKLLNRLTLLTKMQESATNYKNNSTEIEKWTEFGSTQNSRLLTLEGRASAQTHSKSMLEIGFIPGQITKWLAKQKLKSLDNLDTFHEQTFTILSEAAIYFRNREKTGLPKETPNLDITEEKKQFAKQFAIKYQSLFHDNTYSYEKFSSAFPFKYFNSDPKNDSSKNILKILNTFIGRQNANASFNKSLLDITKQENILNPQAVKQLAANNKAEKESPVSKDYTDSDFIAANAYENSSEKAQEIIQGLASGEIKKGSVMYKTIEQSTADALNHRITSETLKENLRNEYFENAQKGNMKEWWAGLGSGMKFGLIALLAATAYKHSGKFVGIGLAGFTAAAIMGATSPFDLADKVGDLGKNTLKGAGAMLGASSLSRWNDSPELLKPAEKENMALAYTEQIPLKNIYDVLKNNEAQLDNLKNGSFPREPLNELLEKGNIPIGMDIDANDLSVALYKVLSIRGFHGGNNGEESKTNVRTGFEYLKDDLFLDSTSAQDVQNHTTETFGEWVYRKVSKYTEVDNELKFGVNVLTELGMEQGSRLGSWLTEKGIDAKNLVKAGIAGFANLFKIPAVGDTPAQYFWEPGWENFNPENEGMVTLMEKIWTQGGEKAKLTIMLKNVAKPLIFNSAKEVANYTNSFQEPTYKFKKDIIETNNLSAKQTKTYNEIQNTLTTQKTLFANQIAGGLPEDFPSDFFWLTDLIPLTELPEAAINTIINGDAGPAEDNKYMALSTLAHQMIERHVHRMIKNNNNSSEINQYIKATYKITMDQIKTVLTIRSNGKEYIDDPTENLQVITALVETSFAHMPEAFQEKAKLFVKALREASNKGQKGTLSSGPITINNFTIDPVGWNKGLSAEILYMKVLAVFAEKMEGVMNPTLDKNNKMQFKNANTSNATMQTLLNEMAKEMNEAGSNFGPETIMKLKEIPVGGVGSTGNPSTSTTIDNTKQNILSNQAIQNLLLMNKQELTTFKTKYDIIPYHNFITIKLQNEKTEITINSTDANTNSPQIIYENIEIPYKNKNTPFEILDFMKQIKGKSSSGNRPFSNSEDITLNTGTLLDTIPNLKTLESNLVKNKTIQLLNQWWFASEKENIFNGRFKEISTFYKSHKENLTKIFNILEKNISENDQASFYMKDGNIMMAINNSFDKSLKDLKITFTGEDRIVNGKHFELNKDFLLGTPPQTNQDKVKQKTYITLALTKMWAEKKKKTKSNNSN
jgi:hypothetical protein